MTKAVVWRCSLKKVFSKLRNIHRKTPELKSPFLNKAVGKAWKFIKRDCNTGVFLRRLQNVLERLF